MPRTARARNTPPCRVANAIHSAPQVRNDSSSRVIEAPVRPIGLTCKLNCCSAVSMPGTVRYRFGESQPDALSVRIVRCCPTCPRSPRGHRQVGDGSAPARAPGNAFKWVLRSAVGGGIETSMAEPSTYASKPERRLISPAPLSMDKGISSALGRINRTTRLLRLCAALVVIPPSRFGDPKGNILRI